MSSGDIGGEVHIVTERQKIQGTDPNSAKGRLASVIRGLGFNKLADHVSPPPLEVTFHDEPDGIADGIQIVHDEEIQITPDEELVRLVDDTSQSINIIPLAEAAVVINHPLTDREMTGVLATTNTSAARLMARLMREKYRTICGLPPEAMGTSGDFSTMDLDRLITRWGLPMMLYKTGGLSSDSGHPLSIINRNP